MIVKTLSKISRVCKGLDLSIKYNSFSTSQSAESTDVDAIFAMLEEEGLVKELKIKQKTAKFEREWELITLNKAADMANRMKGYFQESNEKRAKLFIENMLDLNPFEVRYFISILKTRAGLKIGVPRDGLVNAQYQVLNQPDYRSWAPANPNWSQQQELVAQLWPLGKEGMSKVFQESAKELATIHGVDLTAVAAQQQQQLEAETQAKKEPEKPAAVKEKTHYEIQLTAIDAAQKIKVIKEVRQALNLGLKEAKDLVEKAPCSLKKDVKKEEAEDLKAKLEAAGCTITLL